MSPNDLLEDLRKRPFGYTSPTAPRYDIRHPEPCMVGTSSVGVASNPDTLIFERMIRIDCRHIHKAEPIRGMSNPNNGQSG